MRIREAKQDDINDILPMAIEMHAESRYKALKFDVEKTAEFLTWCMLNEDCLLIVAETNTGEIVGGFAGAAMEQWFSNDRYATDFALFVSHQHRGSTAAYKMISHYVGWASLKNAKLIQLGVSTGVHPEETGKFFEAIGFKRYGGLYEWRR